MDVIIEDDRWKTAHLPALAKAVGDAMAAHFPLSGAGVGLLACNDARVAILNADFRGNPQPTNVLSWPSQQRSAAPGQHPAAPDDLELGDIAIAYETCARESEAQGKEFSTHVTHLLVHGSLHLLGYDHINEKDAALMEGLEVEILGKMGISDPYE